MGCFSSKEQQPQPPSSGYSWDRRENRDPSHYRFVNLSGSHVKSPGDINGQAFGIQDCQNASLFVCDNLATVTIDHCKNCDIFLGPTAGSVFLRNCTLCRVIVACQQLRTRDCDDVDICLFCQSFPIIEASQRMVFRCFRGSYFALGGQMTAANLVAQNNFWWKVYDFTPSEGNWRIAQEDPSWLEGFYERFTAALPTVHIESTLGGAAIQQTSGVRDKDAPAVFVMIFGATPREVKKFYHAIRNKSIGIVEEKMGMMGATDVLQLIDGNGSPSFPATEAFQMVGLELTGPASVEADASASLTECGLMNSHIVVGADARKVASKFFSRFHDALKV